MNKGWFWGALLFWSLLGAGAASWGLILSPMRSSLSIVSFKARLNGQWTHHKIERSHLPLPEAIEKVSLLWRGEGWTHLPSSLPLAPILLGLENTDPRIARHLRIDLFKRDRALRLLGSWRKGGTTYQWTAGLPDGLTQRSREGIFRGFPLPPPKDGVHTFQASWEGIEMACWSTPRSIDPASTFRLHCRSLGFQCRYRPHAGPGRIAVVQKGLRKMLAILERNGDLDTFILMDIPGSQDPSFRSDRSDGSVGSKEE